jgi:hypothetical protein
MGAGINLKPRLRITERGRVRRVHLYLIKPSNYDDEGYVVRYFKGVLPSSTLACLAALTEAARKRKAFAGIRFQTHLIDETVSWINCRRICRSQKSGTKTIVGLVGVQTNQFSRARAAPTLCQKVESILVVGSVLLEQGRSGLLGADAE